MVNTSAPQSDNVIQTGPGFTWEDSRRRWRSAEPDEHLTWGIPITGDAFIDKASSYGAFGPDADVLEVGPGYGRLLSAALRLHVDFRSWLGVDLSAKNVEHLAGEFGEPGVRFVQDEVETLALDSPADTVVSSLTFKHLFPTFEKALRNLAGQMRPRGTVVFDLIEGSNRLVEDDGETYIRQYERGEVEEILAGAGLDLVAFDDVLHHRDYPSSVRLLVVARSPGLSG